MESIKGTLIVRSQYPGTKSEGNIALLISDDLKIYKLERDGHFPIDDDYFYAFDRQDIEVIGNVIDDNYVTVNEIRPIHTNESDHEENMS